MTKQVFINLAVQDIEKSLGFYTKMGFTVNPQFSDDTAKCLVWSENIFLMIMNHEKFKSFATKPLADTKNNLAGLFSLSVESVEKVNEKAKCGAFTPIALQNIFVQADTSGVWDTMSAARSRLAATAASQQAR